MSVVQEARRQSIYLKKLEAKMIIRWVCEKDNKKWLYPVEKCIYCKGPVIRQVSKKAKVIGITKVNIPSPLHPITPYNVILLEDEFHNRMPKKTMKDYKIGDTYELEKAKADDAVIITKVKYDLGEALESSLELLNSFEIVKGDKVLIKPCIIEPAYTYQAVNTNPRLLDEIVKFLKQKGISDIIIGDMALPMNDVQDSANKCEIIAVCKKHEIKFVDLGKTDHIEKEFGGLKLNIAKDVFERKVINVPAMKTNSQLGISGAMENMLRVVDQKTQNLMFTKGIELALPKLIKALPKFLTIGDATSGMHGNGPTSLGEPAFMNLLFVSKDPVAIDAVFSEAGMIPMPDYIKEAGKIGAGISDVRKLEIVGDEIEAVKWHLKLPEKDATAHPRIKLIDGKADPYILNNALGAASKLVGVSGFDLNIAVGKFITEEMVRDKERIVAYGIDAIQKLRDFGVPTAAEIHEGMGDIEKVMLLKSILENPKAKVSSLDKLKSKFASFVIKK
jgi:uncharacterized protein (DUF362 family)/uncharacterized OB-fold protein